MTAPRVLLVEDDASVRRFVELALEDLPIALVSCTTVAEAIAQIAQAPVHLLITDLMLPDESGFSLLRHLRDRPGTDVETRLVAYSAGITPAVREELESLGVWKILHKPVALETLRQCVVEGTSRSTAIDQNDAPHPTDDQASAQAHALATYFAGNVQLFQAYRATCLQQFKLDAEDAEAAFAQRDAPALHRLGHSLKTVFRTIGDAPGSEAAGALERAAAIDNWEAVAQVLPALRYAMTRQTGD